MRDYDNISFLFHKWKTVCIKIWCGLQRGQYTIEIKFQHIQLDKTT